MKKTLRKIVAVVCAVMIMCSIAVMSVSADSRKLTRRLYGDVNGDGVISMADALMTQQAAVRAVELDNIQKIAADVNGDGRVTLADAVDIQRLVKGIIDEFTVGECFYY